MSTLGLPSAREAQKVGYHPAGMLLDLLFKLCQILSLCMSDLAQSQNEKSV